MGSRSLTDKELESFKIYVETAAKAGIDWSRALSLFPPQNEKERRWKKRMLDRIELACSQPGSKAPGQAV